jgi:nucleotide-binding universal stress UspA family protein
MWDRLLLAIDPFESGQTALHFTASIAAANDADVRVVHFREMSKLARVPPLETVAEAEQIVHEAVLALRLAGLGAEGRARSILRGEIAHRIVEESFIGECDAIILGSRRLHGLARLSSGGCGRRCSGSRCCPCSWRRPH